MNATAEVWNPDTGHHPEVEFASIPISALAQGERRMEAETYLAGGYGLGLQIEASLPHERLGNIAKVWQPGRLKGTQVSQEHGMPFLTATQIFDIRPVPRKWIAPAKTPDLRGRLIERNMILVTCSGNVGDALVSFAPHLNTVVSHDLLRVEPNDPAKIGYLYTYLRSGFGKAIVRSSKYGSVVKHLEPEHLSEVPVPDAPGPLRKILGETIGEVFRLRERAYILTLESEQIFAKHLQTPESVDVLGYEVPASRMFSGRRRLDGYHYNPAATQVEEILSRMGTVQSLGSLVDEIVLPNRFARVYVETGISYLDSEDIFKINPEITKHMPERAKTDLAKYMVQANWLLVARSGQIYGLNGSVMLANRRHEGKVISEHIIRVIPASAKVRSGYLAMALGHPVFGRPLVLRLTFGSSVPEIAPEDLAEVPVLRMGSVEDEIADRMETASTLRVKADDLEDEAVATLDAELSQWLEAEVGGGSRLRGRRGPVQ